MNECLIKEWNKVVRPQDHVFYLGDFSLSKRALSVVSRLNGEKVLIPGNHDSCFPGNRGHVNQAKKYLEAGFSEVLFIPLHRIFEKVEFLAWHLPYRPEENDPINKDLRYLEWRPRDEGKWLLHGHTHGRWKKRGRMIDVGVDAWDMRPASWDEIKQLMEDPRVFIPPKTSGGLAFTTVDTPPQELVL